MTQEHPDKLDQAVSKRLSRLATMPVDSAALRARLAQQLAEQTQPAEPRRLVFAPWRLAAGLAAALMLGVLVLLMQMNTTSPAVASPPDLAQLHRQLVSGEGAAAVASFAVSDLAEANRRIAAQSSGHLTLPSRLPGSVRSCCLHDVEGRIVAAVLMEYAGEPVTMVVADGRDLGSMAGRTVERGGRSFVVHEMNGLMMAMASRGDQWLCVMGELEPEVLLDLAFRIEF